MATEIRVFFWGIAVLANCGAIYLFGKTLLSLGEAPPSGSGAETMVGAMIGGSLVSVFALALAVLFTCLAISVDGLTRSKAHPATPR
ncbi:hypothetical protein [Sandarakinorhabdus sp. DWP1-3-1]|uniref:hypothetical protein n=1 Tax=Sandarakinorhabdus sp. DWP1-3-1 TaxID=2804627 RepID=UPI003CF0C613